MEVSKQTRKLTVKPLQNGSSSYALKLTGHNVFSQLYFARGKREKGIMILARFGF